MGGGLLNLVAYGNQNIILNGNPSKTFFKCTYAKYTNFGLQKFRIDYNGLRTLRMTEPSVFTFKVPRYADLLMDTYLVVNLPTIWSPISPDCSGADLRWYPYEFKWIENIGTQMIKRVRFSIGGQVIQEFTGQYLYNLVERDFESAKKDLYYKMTGNIPELNDPANALGRGGHYPNAYKYTTDEADYQKYGPEPSIRGRQLYVPLNIWFTLAAKMAFPLVSLQYQEFYIELEIRPVNELFTVNIVEPVEGGPTVYSGVRYTLLRPPPPSTHHQPNFNNLNYQFYRFLQPPPDLSLNDKAYTDMRTDWNADVHLLSTYAFLSDEEVRVFAGQPQQYLIRDVHEYEFENVTGSKRVELRSSYGMVSNWMWYFQRSDAYLRNEWSNYTNWDYNNVLPLLTSTYYQDPTNVPKFDFKDLCDPGRPDDQLTPYQENIISPSGSAVTQQTGFHITGQYNPDSVKPIMETWGLLFDGKYRENKLSSGVFSYVEKYANSSGCSPDGLYCYNFCLNTSPFDFQPSGAINLSKFTKIEFEFTTYTPPLNPNAQQNLICSTDSDGNSSIIGVNKPTWRIYDYNYNLTVMEERYNILTFKSGNAGLMYAR